ncbi:PREDICTED: protein FAR1-RELATED SEQUENCE 12-like isoform X2 [Nelumbo nucifera]|nr:PREDICTED: protein FAR1-RELATED SEQUENCE 12-like isoform X2 [Nelumbo nucifera]XP_010277382.1 PREDICTED: protein FAR1-RELATED SEQUENCE 12-like isoform X2 [Nelumbo nucifera]XP_010277383.1 PREDICTED: protein FAR1-RELATED SEQUENCE 12-like isoform X2 [Nelumbo nucifera]XP_010277385.1 PREDICTED: protein FAR1-RELATED SEQUENCE 12-like isoform X2 [Nelumbo nucifera]XP_019055710.1 PREDICTED: protein FAR1-RELATED SEQUENCE 12-like isoform X2 [Nelumbo nucifera]
MEYNIDLGQDILEADVVIQAPQVSLDMQESPKGDEMENNLTLGQDISDADVMVFDESIQHPQLTVDIQESLKEDIDTTESGVRDDNHASVNNLVSEPYIGLQFSCEDEAYEYYNAYAKEKGFSIRKSRVERSKVDKSVLSRKYVCAHEGFRWTKDKRYKGKVVRSRRETRIDCRAAMSIKRSSGKWVVYKVHNEHNHELVNPVEAYKLRSHRKMLNNMRVGVSTSPKCSVVPCKIMDREKEASSGDNNMCTNNQDCKNNMKKERRNNIGVDYDRALEYFQSMQAADPGFIYAIEDGKIVGMKNIFWADSRAREAYKQFGDVVIFDTTYQTDKYKFPFAPFIGVNHHKHSTLFGCGLLADESVESYIWLFETWLRAMSGCQPASIITYQDKAMTTAIEKVFPQARHRFCMWQVAKSELENLTYVFRMHKEFQTDYKKCIEMSQTSEEFESGWEALLMKYNLKENSWLKVMYEQRHHWVPLYLQGAFFAGLTTTRRNDSIHSYFDGFLHEGTPFNEFIPQYEQALNRLREREDDEDFVSMHAKAILKSKNPIEEHAAKVYTRSIFSVFGDEFLESSCCVANKIDEKGSISNYMVGKYNEKDDKMKFVTFNSVDNSTSCSCQMFESEGMLCRHILKVFQMVNVFKIPPQYILKRWTMSARYVSFNDEVGGGSKIPTTVNVWTLKETAKKFVEIGATCTERTKAAISILQEGMERLSHINIPISAVGCSSSFQGENANEQHDTIRLSTTMCDPSPVKATGSVASSKDKSGTEHGQKKKRKCRTCGETKHHTHLCSKGPPDQSHTAPMLQGPIAQSHTATPMLQGPLAQSHTAPMLRGPVVLPQPFAMFPGPVVLPHTFAML